MKLTSLVLASVFTFGLAAQALADESLNIAATEAAAADDQQQPEVFDHEAFDPSYPGYFPYGARIVSGTPVRRSDGRVKCRISCGGGIALTRVEAYRFIFGYNPYPGYNPNPGYGPGPFATQWMRDGGTIVCNPFQTFDIGNLRGGYTQFVSSCQVALN